jgi:hypothetical protein
MGEISSGLPRRKNSSSQRRSAGSHIAKPKPCSFNKFFIFSGFTEVHFHANRKIFVTKIFSTSNFSSYRSNDGLPPKCHPRAGGEPAPRNKIFIELGPRQKHSGMTNYAKNMLTQQLEVGSHIARTLPVDTCRGDTITYEKKTPHLALGLVYH